MSGSSTNSSTGAAGEAATADHYRRAGYRVLARNWRCRFGELDLVVARGRTIVFCEVKTRRGAVLGGPFEAVTWKKQAKLRALAEAFLATERPMWDQVRFDVASVSSHSTRSAVVYVYEAAF